MKPLDRLIQYGTSEALAEKATQAGLTATKIRALSQKDLRTTFGLALQEVQELKKCVARQPIANETLDGLLARNNHTCCICKGVKGGGIIVHHIKPYETSQDNSYGNLAVLCPNDHDRAHTTGGLSMSLTEGQILKAKASWEKQVELGNAQAAANEINIVDEAVDYVNVMRIEELCVSHFGNVPDTSITPRLKRKGILDEDGHFDEVFVRNNLSGRKYLFDYINSSETEHYRQLLEKLSPRLQFQDLSDAARSGIRRLKALEGRYTYFIGGVTSKQPSVPITQSSPPITFQHKARKVRIEWDGDPNYLQSMSAIVRQGRKNNYIIYGLVRTVTKAEDGTIEVTASPLLIAQPKHYVDRTPAIHWRRYWQNDDDPLDDDQD